LQSALFINMVWRCLAELGELGADECRSNGFTTNLLCSSCKDLVQFNLEPLFATCQQSCSKDELDQQANKRYAIAELEICG